MVCIIAEREGLKKMVFSDLTRQSSEVDLQCIAATKSAMRSILFFFFFAAHVRVRAL